MKCIKIFGKNVVTLYEHDIMSVSILEIPKVNICDIQVTRINKENLKICENGSFNIKIMKRYLDKHPDKAEGYLFTMGDEILGYLWIMFRGGNEIQYKIRNIDAFIFDVCVFPTFRGKGYVGKMFYWLALYLKNRNIERLYLACRTDNISAQKAYAKLGMQTQERKRFYRILKRNIPYYEL